MRERGGWIVRGQRPLLQEYLVGVGAQECANAVAGLFADAVRSYSGILLS
jgi:hypothetical protein